MHDATYNTIRPQSTKPARAHGLPKTHKSFDNLPTFHPIIDTTGTAYQSLAKYLSTLLKTLTHNGFNYKTVLTQLRAFTTYLHTRSLKVLDSLI